MVDFTVHMVGPFALRMLADLGAEVIHIEERGKGDPLRSVGSWFGHPLALPGGRHLLFDHHNRNKISILGYNIPIYLVVISEFKDGVLTIVGQIELPPDY